MAHIKSYPLGFTWSYPVLFMASKEIARACFRLQKVFPEYVWNTVYLEDNPFTFPEVQTLLEGITVGGHRLEDQQQVLNQSNSLNRLLTLVKQQTFALDKSTKIGKNYWNNEPVLNNNVTKKL